MVINGTTYNEKTPEALARAIEGARVNGTRVRFWYGKDGVSWDEENDTIGTIGRSTGTSKIPLLIKNKRSHGGGALLDQCIVKLIDAGNKRVMWAHPKFKQSYFGADDIMVWKGRPEENPEIYATCKTTEQAQRLAAFMNGKRNSK